MPEIARTTAARAGATGDVSHDYRSRPWTTAPRIRGITIARSEGAVSSSTVSNNGANQCAMGEAELYWGPRGHAEAALNVDQGPALQPVISAI